MEIADTIVHDSTARVTSVITFTGNQIIATTTEEYVWMSMYMYTYMCTYMCTYTSRHQLV